MRLVPLSCAPVQDRNQVGLVLLELLLQEVAEEVVIPVPTAVTVEADEEQIRFLDGLATALKRRQLAWASANGIRELVTWTQQGNEPMQQVNLRLGYVPRAVSRTVRRDLP